MSKTALLASTALPPINEKNNTQQVAGKPKRTPARQQRQRARAPRQPPLKTRPRDRRETTHENAAEEDGDSPPPTTNYLVPDPQVWREFGITSMTGWRWTNDPELSFPPPVRIRNRCYRSRQQIEAFKQRMLRQAMKACASGAGPRRGARLSPAVKIRGPKFRHIPSSTISICGCAMPLCARATAQTRAQIIAKREATRHG
jgi:hypothetical protein